MYDWITASYDIKDEPHQRFIQPMVQTSEVKNMFTNTTWANGYITNNENGRKMGYSVSDNRIKIKICPNKYVLGNNVQEALINDVFETLQDLSNKIGVDLGLFRLEKLDVTHTALTDFVPEAYFPYLCNTSGYSRHVQDTSLYYGANSNKVTLVFYDKVNEVKHGRKKQWGGKQQIPIELNGANLTRFEGRLQSNKEIQRIIGHGAFLGQLFLEEHVMQLQNWWHNSYDSIPKKTKINWQFKDNMGHKAVKETISNLGYMSLGRLEIEKLIELADKQGAFNHRTEKSRIKKQLLGRFETQGMKHEIIKELDEKYKKVEPKW